MPTHTPGLSLSDRVSPPTESRPNGEQTELRADDSASSADATTAPPMGSSVNDGGDAVAPVCHDNHNVIAVEAVPGASKPPWETATLQAP